MAILTDEALHFINHCEEQQRIKHFSVL